ncbi:MAG: 2-oxo acid dehydrogenase subunit E2 [Gammaproteobacteria bacterium]
MSEVKKISITDIAEFDSVDVVEILVKVGDEISIDQPLVTIESEKAMMDYPSPLAGVVEEVIVRDGDKIVEGDALIALKVASRTTEIQAQSEAQNLPDPRKEISNHTTSSKVKAHQVSSNSVASQDSNQGRISGTAAYTSPENNKYSRELGVNLENVRGTGRNQRIVKEDIQEYVRERLQGGHIEGGKSDKPLDFSKYGDSSAKELTKIQKLTADNMLNAWQSIPHVTHFDQADITQLERHRKQLANELTAKKIKLTPLVFVAKALVATLKKFPQFNCSLDVASETIIYKEFFHIGIAVDTEYGLFVPVLREVDKKSIEQLAVELVEISELAKQRKLTPKHMGGASMTISSLGNLGGQSFTPIINPPEVAILGLSKMILKESVLDSNITQQKLLPLSLSYDHRVINGADAARFCTYLTSVLEDIWKLIL